MRDLIIFHCRLLLDTYWVLCYCYPFSRHSETKLKKHSESFGKKDSECFQISLVPFWYAWTKFVQVFRKWLHSEWYMWMLQTIWFSRSHRKSSFRAKPLYFGFGILLPKLFWPTVRKNCSSDQEKFWNSRLRAENLQSLEQFIQTVKGQKNCW